MTNPNDLPTPVSMDDEQFMRQFQRQPRPEFAQALFEQLRTEESPSMASTSMPTTTVTSPTNNIAVSQPASTPSVNAAAIQTVPVAPTAIIRPAPKPLPINGLGVVETILRYREAFFEEIREEYGLREKILAMLVSCAVFLGLYGGVMGASHSIPQVISSSVKLPALFLVTLVICTPSLYFFNLLFGSRQTLGQNIAIILTAMTATSVLLVSFAPVTLFFLTTIPPANGGYQFFKLLNVAIFGLSGLMGVMFLRQGFRASVDADNPDGAQARRRVFLLWVILYAFVGTQLAWTLRPFMGAPDIEFQVFRPNVGSNFYSNVVESGIDFLNGE